MLYSITPDSSGNASLKLNALSTAALRTSVLAAIVNATLVTVNAILVIVNASCKLLE
jgi:hypothetical protein